MKNLYTSKLLYAVFLYMSLQVHADVIVNNYSSVMATLTTGTKVFNIPPGTSIVDMSGTVSVKVDSITKNVTFPQWGTVSIGYSVGSGNFNAYTKTQSSPYTNFMSGVSLPLTMLLPILTLYWFYGNRNQI